MHKDNEKYWIKRHVELRNDIRSVGNLAKDVETNMRGYALKIERLRNAILATLGSIEHKAVLEVGCGVGMMAPDLLRIGARYTGIDISHMALAKAQEKCPSGTFICHSAFEYKLETRFALVFCTDVLVHLIKDENWRLALKNMSDHLEKNGVILIKEDIGNERRSPSPHVVSRSLSEYSEACRELGLSFQPVESAPGFYCLTPLRDLVRPVSHDEDGRLCPVCGMSSPRFLRFGRVPREDAQCPNCGALERHRLFWVFLETKTSLFDANQKKMLHIAPEACLESKLRERVGAGYLTGDLGKRRAMVKMDISDIQFPDETFDVVYCSHVLEHVPDDKRAMSELFRVLKNDGWAVLLVPINSKKTFEDPSIVDPKERLEVFGQEDHVRRYGPDYVDRLRDAGFFVEVFKVSDIVSQSDALQRGLTENCGDIYYCTKRTSSRLNKG